MRCEHIKKRENLHISLHKLLYTQHYSVRVAGVDPLLLIKIVFLLWVTNHYLERQLYNYPIRFLELIISTLLLMHTLNELIYFIFE